MPRYKAAALTLTEGQQTDGGVDVNGRLLVANTPAVSGTATLTSVVANIASVTLLAANTARKGASIANTSTSILYLRIGGGTATATTGHSVQMAANTYFELPYGYTGAITGIWVAANGQANVTEYT